MALTHFGTDGIRGEYGGSKLNDALAYRAGVAAAIVAKSNGETAPTMIVGRDTRASGAALLGALAAGFASEGGTIESIGVVPTPAVAKIVSQGEASLGCAITASHNPYTDNGIKFFQSNGTKPSAEMEQALDDAVSATAPPETLFSRKIRDGANERVSDYGSYVKGAFPSDLLKGKRIALDCANGATCQIAGDLFEHFGATTVRIGCSPNGANINEGVGSECPQAMQSLFANERFDMGFAFDGDGDRMIAFDENGNPLAGEATLGLLAIHAKAAGTLRADTLVTTLQSNLGLDDALKHEGIAVVRVDIGDKFVARLMLAEGYSLGGEESGHVVVGAHSLTGDGLVAALSVAQAAVDSGAPLSALAAFYVPFPQQTRAIRVSAKPPIEDCPRLQATIEALRAEFGEEGRLLVRYSGTEPKIRLLVEAKTDAITEESIARLERAVAEDLN